MGRIIYADGYEKLEYKDNFITLLDDYNEWAKEFLYGHSYKQLMATSIWKEARSLIVDYFKDAQGISWCAHCDTEIKGSPILHHEHYYNKKIFNLNSISILCRHCNTITHRNKWRNK